LNLALKVIEASPASAERRALELDLRSLLGITLLTTEGYGSPNVRTNSTRAEELVQEGSLHAASGIDREKEFLVAWGIWAYHLVLDDLEAAERAAERLERLAAENDGLRLEARLSSGMARFYRATDHARALKELESVCADYDRELHG